MTAHSFSNKPSDFNPNTENLRPTYYAPPQPPQPSRSTNVVSVGATNRTPVTRSAYLVLVYPPGPTVGTSYELGDEPLIIGRNPECAIPAVDNEVSRRHARVEKLPDGQYQITDIGSVNGTYVNTERTEQRILRDGDAIRIGGFVFRFLVVQ